MKKPIVKLASIAAFALLFSFASCDKPADADAKKDTEPVVELKITTPQPSPFSKIEQKVGLTDVTLEYSRPSAKGRAIFGNLVPFGKIWRTGANANTKITFSTDVVVDGQTLKAGSYGIYSIPNKDKWEVMFYSESNKRGVPSDWNESKVVAKTTIDVYPMPMAIETYTITFDDLTNNSAVIGLLWEKTYIGIKFEVPTDAIVMASIDATLAATPKGTDYYNAAVYYSQQDKDIKQANEWMEKAMSMIEKPRFFQLRQQSLIYAKVGNKEAAIATAQKSLELSKEAKNDAYIKMNTDSLKEWGVE